MKLRDYMPPAEMADLELIQFRCLKLYSFNIYSV